MALVSASPWKMMVCRLLVIASILATTQARGQCLDWLPRSECKARAKEGGCEKNKTLMHDNCCQTCMKYNTTVKPPFRTSTSGIQPTSVLQPTASTKVWKPTQPHRQCVDWLSRSECEAMAKEGGCEKNKTLMHDNCCQTCMKYNTTAKPRQCLDWLPRSECKARAKDGGCEKNKTLMHDNCCQTCMKYNTTAKPHVRTSTSGIQPTSALHPTASTKVWKPTLPHSQCLDWLQRSQCKARAKEGGCVKNKTFMHVYCCRTCMKYNTTAKPRMTSEAPMTTQQPTTLADIDGTWGNKKDFMTIALEENGQNLIGAFCTRDGSSYDLRGGISLGIPASIGFTVTFQGNGKPTSTRSWSGQYRLVDNKGVLYTKWVQTTPTNGKQSIWASTHTGQDVFEMLESGFSCPSIVVPL